MYTDSTSLVFPKYESAFVPVRANSSELINSTRYSSSAEHLFVRRCIKFSQSSTLVTRPNLVAAQGFSAPTNNRPVNYNKTLLCLSDDKKNNSQVNFQFRSRSLTKSIRSFGKIEIKIYNIKHLGEIDLPHFSKLQPVARNTRKVVLLSIEGSLFSCSSWNEWCATLLPTVGAKNAEYSVIYPVFDGRNSPETFDLKYFSTVMQGTHPINVSVAMRPKLSQDRFMMRPKRTGAGPDSIVTNLQVITKGYNWGLTTRQLEEKEALVGLITKIVPTVQLGYLVALSIIISMSGCLLAIGAALTRRRKIRGLVGEHAFLDRWNGHLEGNGDSDRLHGRTQLVVVRAGEGVGQLQPSVSRQAVPLSAIDKMK